MKETYPGARPEVLGDGRGTSEAMISILRATSEGLRIDIQRAVSTGMITSDTYRGGGIAQSLLPRMHRSHVSSSRFAVFEQADCAMHVSIVSKQSNSVCTYPCLFARQASLPKTARHCPAML